MADAVKWSRNLSEASQSDANRFRLIERQRQILEAKRQRQHQVVATSTRPSSGRPQTAGALSLHRSVERLIDLEDGNDSGLVNTGFNTSDEKNSPSQEATAPRTPSSPKKQLARQKSHEVLLAQSSPLSSPEISTHSTKQDTDVNQKSLRLNFVDPQQEADQEILQLNPLTTILTNEQLLLFATQPISPQTTLQCTIIRDKKGIDRSLYPTYFMHLQAIVSNDQLSNDKPLEASSPTIKDAEEGNDGANGDTKSKPGRRKSSTSGYRQVFLLSGRRRKKSKTYLIAGDPFDIGRNNCIAKLKSNVLGTQFTAIRIHADGQRQEIATIIYVISHWTQNLMDEWKRNNKNIIQLKNKTPIWNDETQSYVLNFHGRVTQASVKNFQLVQCKGREEIAIVNSGAVNSGSSTLATNATSSASKQQQQQQTPTTPASPSTPTSTPYAPTNPTTTADTGSSELVSMQFGRVSNSQFTCDVSWPMSLLQAFAIALSSFDSKLACE